MDDALPPSEWLEALARGKAQAESGHTVPLEPILDGLKASIARMEEDQLKP